MNTAELRASHGKLKEECDRLLAEVVVLSGEKVQFTKLVVKLEDDNARLNQQVQDLKLRFTQMNNAREQSVLAQQQLAAGIARLSELKAATTA